MGTGGGGLAHHKSDGTWEVIDTNNSDFPLYRVYELLSDGHGGIWVGTEDGLAHLTYDSAQIAEERYLTGKRAAIIIAGGGNTRDNTLWNSTEVISNYIYKMFSKRGFLNSDIYYLSPENGSDFNGDGMDDRIIDAPRPQRQLRVEDIREAFKWAKTKGGLNQPLYIFFTDHGGFNRLQLASGVFIESEELKGMLDDYQQSTENKVVFVIDACHSGTMMETLAGSDRAIISSTNKGLSYFDRRDGQSFIYFLTKALFKGMNFLESFHSAVSKQKNMLGKLSDYAMFAGNAPGEYSQEPLFDDTGDGVYTAGDEGSWLKQVTINGALTMADITLAVDPLLNSGVISAFDRVIFKVKATLAEGRVNRVWAVIRPPRVDIIVDNTGIPLITFPTTALQVSTVGIEEDVWEGTWDGFVYNGEYEVTFYAEDNDGNIESSSSIRLNVTDGLDCPLEGSVELYMNGGTYKPGDHLKVSVTENLAYGYDLYLVLTMPDGRFVAIEGSNRVHREFNRPSRWYDINRNQGEKISVLDIIVSKSLADGEYCVYAVLSPERGDFFSSVSNWVMDSACFQMKSDAHVQ